ncbi:hypothetical protein BX616_010030 [Lobosporangium transversale]|uniref:phosphatidate phosphatase n=1 Tax=Lobosporangium transversale TaxID=64571 RepID=A0A1Y2G792_9FUNG|nr:Lipin/Ned1/Smp2-domain-containing protein [Lobosporangium transversale]KAF9913444.1 hypothetical protein BX616_010030 [Lobosporangium transversale]ORY99704.1 Lipin/Ned1/Smp2-domain-containing protein [Lobosporangium transversale]|eukprot:XP_021875968.1 Lipin/Ned1/Smp2-domain-containing protein [Lobosporangium transversale]
MYSVGNFFSTVTKFYNEINPATLSGAIDIIVVQQADGELACSPFHVRFGKLSILRPQDKAVEVRVNGEVVPFAMKVGDAGEAFFVLETNDYVPDEFATSPLAAPADESDLAPVDYFDLNNAHHQQREQGKLLEGSSGQYPQGDEDNGYVSAASGHGSAFEESLKDDSDHESVTSFTSPSTKATQVNGDESTESFERMPGSFDPPHEALQEPASPLPSLPSNPQSSKKGKQSADATPPVLNKVKSGFPINDIFPTVVHEEHPNEAEFNASRRSRERRRSEVLFDMTGYKTDSCSESSDDENELPRGILSDSERHNRGLRKRFSKKKSDLTKDQRQKLLDDIKQGTFLKPDDSLDSVQAERQASRAHHKKKRAGIPSGWHGRKGRKRANSMPTLGEPDVPLPTFARNIKRHHESQPKKTTTTAEDPPKREPRPSVMSDTEMEYETRAAPTGTQGKEWTWGWGGLPVKQNNPDEEDEVKEESQTKTPEDPVEIETKELQMGSTTCRVAISLCGEVELGKNLVAAHKAFKNAQLTFDAFSKDPAAILADKKLVCYMDGRFYSWNNAMPQLVALLFFHQPLSDVPSLNLKGQKASAEQDRPSSTRFGTISRWFRKTNTGTGSSSSTLDATSTSTTVAPSNESDAVAIGPDDTEIRPVNKALRSKSLPPLESTNNSENDHNHIAVPTLSEKKEGVEEKKRYAKTLRLTSDQLRLLNLKKGANTVSFSVSSPYQGTATCVAKIFLWDYDARVVISDIDGTITKSDALGHIFAMAGRDWTHLGVAKLFTDIRSNGYHILYLTSRAIGQADYTRKYLQKVEQNSYQLPDGPVIMSPDRLFSAFHREVIIRKPEVFKMACLRDIKKLFGDRDPFYAGFGNRITDALSYRAVAVPSSRIFTIDSYGEVKLELLSAFKSSYLALNDLVNEIFPGEQVAPEYNDWNYWKQELPKIDLPDLPLAPDNYTGTGSSSLTTVAKRMASLTHSSSSSTLHQPTSPTQSAVDTKGKRDSSYERSSYASLLSRNETWTSDDDTQDQQQHHSQEDTTHQKSGPEQLKEESKKSKTGSPSMLSALVPARFMRAVRSGSTGNQATLTPQPMTSTFTQSPNMNPIIDSLPSPSLIGPDDVVRPEPFSSSPPSDGLLHMEENIAKTLEKPQSEGIATVKDEDGDEEIAAKKLLQHPNAEAGGEDGTLEEEEGYGGEEEYQGDYEDDDEGEYGDEEDENDEDEYLEQIGNVPY